MKSEKEKTMTNEIISDLAKFIAEKILKQPGKVIAADEALISSGLIDSFSLMTWRSSSKIRSTSALKTPN